MKKLWLLLLAAGAMTLTTACNEEDDGPVCPVECSVPTTAEIGNSLTIAGQGFAATAEIALQSEDGTETKLEDPQISATGYTGTVPVTMTPGDYTVVLYQEGIWEIGAITLTKAADKECPVVNVVLPEAIRLNQALEIAGLGFSEDMTVSLENTSDKARTELTTALSSSGVSCTIPDGMKAGSYNVILTQGIYEWVLGENIPAAVYKRLAGFSKKVVTAYEGVTLEALAEVLLGMGYAPTMEEALKTAESFLPMFSDSEEVTEYTFTYDADGNPKNIAKKEFYEETGKEWFSFTVDGNKISGTNNIFEEGSDDMRSFVWTMDKGRVDQAAVAYEKRENEYVWVYDALGMWTGVNYSSDSPYMLLAYDGGKFLGSEWETMFTYDAAPQQNAIFGIDIAKLIFSLQSINIIESDHMIAICLNLAGEPSMALPSTLKEMDGSTPAITYAFDNDGYVSQIDWETTGGKDMLIGAFDSNSKTTYTLVYE